MTTKHGAIMCGNNVFTNMMYSLLGETHLDDQETNELLCLPTPRKHKHFF